MLRTHDWSTSPLGPPSDWPESLRNVVNLILDSKFPMLVTWGAQLGTIYNDAYAEILGNKHPWAIGLRFDDIWREAWDSVAPLFDGVLAGEASYRESFPLVLQCRGYPERRWFTFSYSPLRDEEGNVAGIYCAICETTREVMAGQHQQFRLELSDRLRGLTESAVITSAAADMLGKYLHADAVAFADLDAHSGMLNFHSAYAAEPGMLLSGRRAAHELGAPLEACLNTGQLQTATSISAPVFCTLFRACSAIIVPIRQGDRLSGILLVADRLPRGWYVGELELVQDLVWRTGVAAEHVRVEAELRSARNFSQEILSSLNEGVALIGHDFRVVYINPEGLRLESREPQEIVGRTLWEVWPGIEKMEAGQLLRQAILERKPVSLEHLFRFANGNDAWLDMRAFPAPDGIVVLYRDVTRRKRAQEIIRQAALHDPLTGLPNRALLFEHASHVFANAQRNKHNVAVLYIDLDRFKPINDNHGHEAGDAVLRQVANRLREKVRQADIACRLGGDEFLILLDNLRGLDGVTEVARHICESLYQPYQFGSLSLSLSASIGISVFPRDGKDIDTLISRADAAMYQTKQNGRDNFQFYSPDLTHRSTLLSMIEDEIQVALQHDKFHLHYQPVINISTGEVISVEALLRWQHEDIGPDRFVPVAEVSGQIGRIGDWVIAQACRQFNSWDANGMPPIPIAINVSAVQFRRKDFADHFAQILHEFKVDPSAMQLELTETALMENVDYTIAALLRFQAMGIKVALDDFGTGYSSMSYLSRLPINKIKVDKSFVQRIEQDMQSRAITEAIISLGRSLHLDIVAEGIESESVLKYLHEHGCDQAQGFHVCMPVAADELESWVRQRAGGMSR